MKREGETETERECVCVCVSKWVGSGHVGGVEQSPEGVQGLSLDTEHNRGCKLNHTHSLTHSTLTHLTAAAADAYESPALVLPLCQKVREERVEFGRGEMGCVAQCMQRGSGDTHRRTSTHA